MQFNILPFLLQVSKFRGASEETPLHPFRTEKGNTNVGYQENKV